MSAETTRVSYSPRISIVTCDALDISVPNFMTQQYTTKHDDQASLRDCHHACGIAKKLDNHSDRLAKLQTRLSARCHAQGTKEEGGSKVPSTSQSHDDEHACPSDNQWCSDLRNIYHYKTELLKYQIEYHTRCIGAGKKGSAEDTHGSEKNSAYGRRKKASENELKGNPSMDLSKTQTQHRNPMHEYATSGNDNVQH